MRFLDILYFCFQSFKNRKAKILLTILGVSVGIGAVLLLTSLGFGLQRALFERIVTRESLLTLNIVPTELEIINLDNRTLQTISLFPEVEKVSPQAIFPSQVSLDDLISETTVNLVNPDFFLLSGMMAETGRFFIEQDIDKIIINSSMAQSFNLEPEKTLGKRLRFVIFVPQTEIDGIAQIETFNPEKEFEIIGVIEEQGEVSQVYFNRRDLATLGIQEYQFAKVMVKEEGYLEMVRERLIGKGFLVFALADMVEQATQIFAVIQIVLGIFGMIALLVAGIGLANTMTVSLLQRISDIGIMRANGAAAKDIKKIFLIESLAIGFLGGIVGVLIGVIGGEVANLGLNLLASFLGGRPVDIFYYPAWFIIFIILLSGITGFIGGYWPANKAARLNPLEALRYK